MAIGERDGHNNNLWRSAGAKREVIDEALDHLESLQIVDDALKLVRNLPYGRQRLVEIAIALAQRPRVLLLDEPAAGVPSSESHLILDVVDKLDPDIAVLIIEHDMDVVFRFAKEITVLVQGAVFTQGTPDEIMRNEDVQRGLSRRRKATMRPSVEASMVEPVLALDKVYAGYGETVVLEDINFTLAPGETVSVIGRNGVGKIDAAVHHHGPHHAAWRQDFAARQRHFVDRDLSAGDRRARPGAAGTRDFSVAVGAGKHGRRGAAGAVDI